MADIKSFTSLLEQTISAPRLSGSKVQSLTALSQSLTLAGKDTELVTTFFRINAALPPTSSGRISSLYVFDAIARGARKDADKEKERGKAREGRGMTGLISKMEGVVDAWVGGMIDNGKGGMWAEGRDKVKKVLDIWGKGSTFPRPTLDRLQSKISSADAGPSRQASSSGYPQVGRSTTPPGEPAAPAFSPVLPPLALPVQGTSNTPPVDIALPPVSDAAAADLPPEILKLLGIQAAAANATAVNTPPPASTTVPTAAPAPTIDIATLLASVRPQPAVQPPAHPNIPPQLAGILGVGATPTPPLPFALDPRQLAALAGLSTPQPVPGATPPHGGAPLPYPNHILGHGQYEPGPNYAPGPHQGNNGYAPYPPADRAPYHPGNGPNTFSPGYNHNGDPRGPPRRGSDGRSPSYGTADNGRNFERGRFSPTRQNDRDRNDAWRRDDGRHFDDRGPAPPPPPQRGWGSRERDEGPGGRDGSWGDRRDSRQNNANGFSGPGPGPGRGRSRSPDFRDGPPRGGDAGYSRRENGSGHRSRGSFDSRDRAEDDGRPGVRKNYGGFKNQAGRFDPPPSAGLPPTPHHQQQQHPQQQQQVGATGRTPLPPGREVDMGRAPPPPGRDLGDPALGVPGLPAKPTSASGSGVSGGDEEDMALDNSDDEAPAKAPAGVQAIPSRPTVTEQLSASQVSFPPVQSGFAPQATFGVGPGPGLGSQLRLETFDISSFNPMMPDSWATLATAYRNSTGREPGQMDLMGFLAGQGPVMPMFGGQGNGQQMS